MTCTVIDIRGDYATVRFDESGLETDVALALLPDGLCVGDRLRRELLEYERV